MMNSINGWHVEGKVIIVTGASQGIGEATARLLSVKGAHVILVARSEERLAELEKELVHSYAIPTDMTDLRAVREMINQAHAHFGRIDGLINNAGQGMYGPLESVDITAYVDIFGLNVLGPLVAMQTAIPFMRSSGGGRIVNISSLVSKNHFPQLGLYASTKYALNALSLTARDELSEDKIAVSVVYPGLTDTDFGKNAIRALGTEHMQSRRRTHMPEPDSPEKVAEGIIYALESGEAEVVVD